MLLFLIGLSSFFLFVLCAALLVFVAVVTLKEWRTMDGGEWVAMALAVVVSLSAGVGVWSNVNQAIESELRAPACVIVPPAEYPASPHSEVRKS